MVECGDECKSLPTQIIVKNVVTYFVMKKKKKKMLLPCVMSPAWL